MENNEYNFGEEIYKKLEPLSKEDRIKLVKSLTPEELELLANYAVQDYSAKTVEAPKVKRPYKTPAERLGRAFSETHLSHAMDMRDRIHQAHMDRTYYSTPVYVAPDADNYRKSPDLQLGENDVLPNIGEVPHSRDGNVIKNGRIDEHPLDNGISPDGLTNEERRDITRKLRQTTQLLFAKANEELKKDNPQIHR